MIWRLVVAFVVTIAVGSCVRSSPGAELMTYAQYVEIEHEVPYIVRILAPSGRAELLYFGARHTHEPTDSEIEDIVSAWDSFRPAVVFNEGGDPPVEATLEEAVRQHGEAGLMRFLAARDGVPVHSIEPDRRTEVDALLDDFTPEQIKLFYVLRQVVQARERMTSDELATHVEQVLRSVGSEAPLDGAPRTLEELAASTARLLPGTSWEAVPSSWFDPAASDVSTNVISRELAQLRDHHMVNTLVRALCTNERVLAVVGASHVVMQEALLRQAIASEDCTRSGVR